VGFNRPLAIVWVKGEPGTMQLVFRLCLAGLDGRSRCLGFTIPMATVSANGEPGNAALGFTAIMAGLDGRSRSVGFTKGVATVFDWLPIINHQLSSRS
jgi:hypothetical protein